MWFSEVKRCLALCLLLLHCVRGEISDELKAAIDGFSVAFDELYPLQEDNKPESAIVPEKVKEEETIGSAQHIINEPSVVKEVAVEEGSTIDMNITPEAKEFARDSLTLIDPSLVLRDVKKFTAEVINGIKRTLIVEVENGDHDIKTCSIELFELPGKNVSKVTWNDCVDLSTIASESEVISPPPVIDSEAVPPSFTSERGVVSPSAVGDSELTLPPVTTNIELTTPCVTVDSELISSLPTTAGSEDVTTEQHLIDSYTTVSENTVGNSDDTDSRRRREMLQPRVFSDIDSKVAEELGKFALSTLDALDANSNKRVLEKIQSAQKELVDGLPLYEIVMFVRETQCPETSSEDCTFSSTDPQQLCSVLLQSSLNNKSPAYARVVKSECN